MAACAPSAGAADLYVSPSGSDGGPCSRTAPCQSFNRAYTVATGGQLVEVAGGSYGGQDIPNDPSKTAGVVTFAPAAGATVSAGWLRVMGDHVEIRSMRVSGWTLREGADDITLRDVDADEQGWWIRSASNVRVIGGDLGPVTDLSPEVSAAWESDVPARNILFDGVTFHDAVKQADDAHVDCLTVGDVEGLTIRNSRFRNCEHFDLIFGNDVSTGRGASNVLVENTFFDCCRTGYYSIGLGAIDGAVFRYNSANLGIGFLGQGVRNVEIHSNVLPTVAQSTCSRANWHHNVSRDGARCGTGDRVAPMGFLDGRGFDFHLTPGAAAIGAGDPSSAPAIDIDGHPRSDGRPDAGADEYGSSPGSGAAPPPVGGQPAAGLIVRGPKRWRRERGAPRATLRVRLRTARSFARNGLPVSVSCRTRCRARARLVLDRRVARTIGVRRTFLSAGRWASRGRPAALRVRVPGTAPRRIAGAPRVTGTLRVTAIAPSGAVARVSVRLTFGS